LIYRRSLQVLFVLLGLAACAGASTSGLTAAPAPGERNPVMWGVAGPLGGPSPALRAAGVEATILELAWRDAAPAAGRWNERYFAAQRSRIAELRAAGIAVVLNTGMHEPPAWALALPGARYVDQAGRVSGDEAGLNLVWNRQLRPLAAAYLAKVFAELGTGFAYVRVGGGELGELTYPRTSGALDSYWAFDDAASGASPVPGWRPGRPDDSRAATVFLGWYLDALTDFQNWQIATVRQHFAGPVAVLYPDVGLRADELARAAAGGLAGSAPAERTRRVQAGQDHERHVAAITDPAVVAWCTWANSADAVASVAEAARPRGIALVGENSGDETTVADLEAMAAHVRAYDLRLVIWVRYADLVAGMPGKATLADYTRISQG
jgi:hypothetical protein